jgi:hypothetical protein
MPDQNGNPLSKNVCYEGEKGWGVNVWAGSHCATNLQRRYYQTRDLARNGDISDTPGNNGCIGMGDYLSGAPEYDDEDYCCY